jgi:amino acid adenylation domain-containing protein
MSEIAGRLSKLSPEDQRALLAQLLQEKAQKPHVAPLSFSQERIWFLEQLIPGSTANIMYAVRLGGKLDVAALSKCVNEIVRRHETLRTAFTAIEDQPAQLIAPPKPVTLPLIDLRPLTPTVRETEARKLANAEEKRRFDLLKGPLFRIRLLWLDGKEHFLVLSFHHSIFDGWSSDVFLHELVALYEAFSAGRESPLPELPIQYADFVHWQRERMQGEVLERHLAYWREQLGSASAPLELPTDRPRSGSQSSQGGRQELSFPKPLSEALQALSQREGVTLFMTLLAGLQVLLYRYTRQENISVGTYIANRNFGEIEGLIGLFTNTLVLRTDLGGNPAFHELLGRVREVTLGAYAHQDIPFDKLLAELRPERELGHTPFFRVMLVLLDAPAFTIKLSTLIIQPVSTMEEETATIDTDLVFLLWDTEEGVAGTVGYDAGLFDVATIHRMWDNLQCLLTEAIANPDERIAALPLINPQETHRLTVELNQTRADYPAESTIHELFAAQVERSPDAVAVSFAGRMLTCTALNVRANRVAHYLRARGVGPDAHIGLCARRSLDTIVGLLGILKAGGTYVPLDPAYPRQRLAFMLQDAQVKFLLTQAELAPNLPQVGVPILCLDRDWDAIAQDSVGNPENVTTPDNLAYVIYTSGSTGQPKGVMVSQRALVHYVTAAIGHFAVTSEDRILQFASISFDTAAEEIYPCLLSGATLVLRTETMLDSVETFLQACVAEGITVLNFPTAYWHTIGAELKESRPPFPSSLRLVIIGGEAALPERLETWQARAPAHVCVANTYGPTETTIVATRCDLTGENAPESAAKAPIGKPIANTQVYVLDPYLRPTPAGVPGELYIGGNGLARGYLGRPELTAATFVPAPFGGVAGARLYKTGDLVRYLPDDNLAFWGRVDHQVKVRGFRVELGEIESALSQHPAVREAVVLTGEDILGNRRLVAYIVPDGTQTDNLSEFLRERLPEYMIPSLFVSLDALPLTPSGKVDRFALPALDETRQEHVEKFVPPETSLEEKLVEIWREVLQVKRIGVLDNFFDLGGNSLLATQVVYRINKAFKIDLPVRSLLEEPDVASLALLIEEILIEELEAT